jgi:hypothetical protein
MNRYLYAIVTFCLLLYASGTVAQERRFGLGVILGEPTGISGKLWVSPLTAIDMGLGWSFWGDRLGDDGVEYSGDSRIHLHMDYLWHWFDAIHSTERFPLYTGIGGRINAGGGDNSTVAVRGVLGIAWLPHQTPIDVFLELVPSLQVVPSTGFGIDAGLGIRYFF